MQTETTLSYCGYTIKPKRDFGKYGFTINGKQVKEGWVVTDGRQWNVMPGATWFQTIESARQAIAALELSKKIAPEDEGNTFWNLMALVRPAEISLEQPRKLQSEPTRSKHAEEVRRMFAAMDYAANPKNSS